MKKSPLTELALSRRFSQTDPHGFYKINDEIYFQSPGLSNSDLSLFLKAPRLYEYVKMYNKKLSDSASKDFGSAVHCALLEPELFHSLWIVAPDCDRRTTIGKAEWAAFIERNVGKKHLTKEAYQAILEIKASCSKYQYKERSYITEELLIGGWAEVAMFWKEPLFERQMRAKVDYIKPATYEIIDIKTTSKGTDARSVAKTIYSHGYYRQAAMYLWGARTLTQDTKWQNFTWIFIDTEAPYEIAVYKASPSMLEQGMNEIYKAIQDFDACMVKNEFGFLQSSGPQVIDLPDWAKQNKNIEELLEI